MIQYYIIRLLLTITFLFPLFLTADTIVVKTEAPQNRNAVFQYRAPKGYDKNRREMYRVLVIFGSRNTAGVADPDKLHQTILDKGGRIKE